MFATAVLVFLCAPSAFAGQFVQKNIYSQAHLAVGRGRSLKLAIQDARSAIPAGSLREFYEPDTNFNSPQYQCLSGIVWTEKSECEIAEVQYVIPLRQVKR